MLIDKNSLIINNVNIGQYCISVKFGYHKQWDEDSGRNLANEVVGSFDLFPKITCEFGKLEQEQIEVLAPILNSSRQSVSYYDPDLKRTNTISTYTGDWELTCKKVNLGEQFTCAFISRSRRA